MCEKKQKMFGGRSHSTLTEHFLLFSCRFGLLTVRSRMLMENLGLTLHLERKAMKIPKQEYTTELASHAICGYPQLIIIAQLRIPSVFLGMGNSILINFCMART